MAQVDHLLAVIAVSDIDVGRAWYTTLFGREPDNNPMPNLVEWHVTENGWVQVIEDVLRAGHGMLNLALSDIEEGAGDLREKGIDAGEIVDANKGVRLSQVTDPDGNTIHLVGSFRLNY